MFQNCIQFDHSNLLGCYAVSIGEQLRTICQSKGSDVQGDSNLQQIAVIISYLAHSTAWSESNIRKYKYFKI